MKKLLITSSLVDSMAWLKSCPKSWKDKALLELTRTLSREPFTPNEYCRRGILFEDTLDVYAGDNDLMLRMKKYISTGEKQKKKYKDIISGDYHFLLYGKCDYLFPGKIVDIKTTNKSKAKFNPKYYIGRSQHKIYLHLWGLDFFEYVIAHLGENMSNIEPIAASYVKISGLFGQTEMKEMSLQFCEDLKYFNLFELYRNVYNTEK